MSQPAARPVVPSGLVPLWLGPAICLAIGIAGMLAALAALLDWLVGT